MRQTLDSATIQSESRRARSGAILPEDNRLVVFMLDSQRYALHLFAVQRVVRAVAVTPLPKAPDVIVGVINVGGDVIPVANIRRRFGLPEREIRLSDQFIIVRTQRRVVALVADAAIGIASSAGKDVTVARALPGNPLIDGVLVLEDGMVLIHDIDRFLTAEEENTLDEAILDM